MHNHEASNMLRSHRIEIDPGDPRSHAEIAAALGIVSVNKAAAVQLQNTEVRPIDIIPTEVRL